MKFSAKLDRFCRVSALPALVCTALLPLVFLGTFWCIRWWPPDVITRRTIVLSTLMTANGDTLWLTQRFVDDGYSTTYTHTNLEGRSWYFPIDGDAPRAWKATLKSTKETVEIVVFGRKFFYDLQTHHMVDGSGVPQAIREIPEDGAEPFFLGPQPTHPTNQTPYRQFE